MAKTLELQITEQQKAVWEIADQCVTEQMKLKDQIFERGCIVAEVDCLMKIYKSEPAELEEWQKYYLLVLFEMKRFYSRVFAVQKGNS